MDLAAGPPGMVVKSLAVFMESGSLLLWLQVNTGPVGEPGNIGWLLGGS